MNEPFNIDEDGMFYDVPPTTPHTLTDERAGCDAPSEAALAFARDWLKSASKIEGITEALATLFDAFAAQQVAAREAKYNALKAVADKMAVAVRSVETDAVVENGYEGDDYDYEFPVHIVDSDYMNTLYQALREYEQATDPALKISK